MAPVARLVTSFRLFSGISGIVVFVTGMLVLAGWFFDVPILRSWHPSVTTVQPSAAVCLALLGASLWLSQSTRTSRRFRIPPRWARWRPSWWRW